MKKLITAIIIGINTFALPAKMLKSEVSTDENTGEMILTYSLRGL